MIFYQCYLGIIYDIHSWVLALLEKETTILGVEEKEEEE